MDKLNNFPKIYWINLNHAKERYNKIIQQFEEFPEIIHQRVEAIHGDTIQNNDEVLYCKSYASILIQKRAQGCTASHIKAIKTYLDDKENKEDYALIAEDDLSLETIPYWKKTWKEYFKMIPEDYDVVKLCNCSIIKKVIKSINEFKEEIKPLKDKIYYNGACIYLIKRECAKKIIDQFYNYVENKIDISKFATTSEGILFYSKYINYYFPLFVYQRVGKSFIRSTWSSIEKFNKASTYYLEYMKNN